MENLPEKPPLRASDSDRDRVAERIRDAAAEGRLTLEEVDERLSGIYAARTYSELEKFTEDLPATAAGSSPAPVSSHAPTSRIGGIPSAKVSVAIMSGATRKGPWVVPPSYTAVAFWGGVELDLRDAKFAEQKAEITAFAMMGGISIIVPDDIDVVVDGVGIMGGFDDSTGSLHRHPGEHPGAGGRPLLRVKGLAFWGGVSVERKAPKGSKPEKKDREIES